MQFANIVYPRRETKKKRFEKLKQRTFLISLILLFLFTIGLIANGKSIEFKIGVKEDEELEWKCNVCNEIEMDTIFSNDWDDSGIFKNLSKGKRMKWKIIDIKKNDTSVEIKFSFWSWTADGNWGVKDNDSKLIYFSNPDDYTNDLDFSSHASFVPFWFPVPVGDYMGGLDLNDWYDVDNRVLPTLNVDIAKDDISPSYPNKNIKIIAIYNDQGILNSYKLYIKGNVVIVDIEFDFLPFYVIPTLIGLAAVLSIGVILYVIKKKKSVINSSKKILISK